MSAHRSDLALPRSKPSTNNKGQKKAKLIAAPRPPDEDEPGPSQSGAMGGSAGSWYRDATFEDVLDDLSSRFILNLPEEELASPERICFQVEQAHWFYEDFIREESPSLPSFSLKKFSELFFRHCPLLSEWSSEHERAFERFMKYKNRVPVCGAILLNNRMDKCVLVKGWKASATWGFPKGKINNEEPKADCAVREVLEETGYNCQALLNPEDYIEVAMNDQRVTLYIVPGVSEEVSFLTQTRKEISAIEWVKLSELPTWKKQKVNTKKKFYMIAPFVSSMKQWIKLHKDSFPRTPEASTPMVSNAQLGGARSGTTFVIQERHEVTVVGPVASNDQAVKPSSALDDLFRQFLLSDRPGGQAALYAASTATISTAEPAPAGMEQDPQDPAMASLMTRLASPPAVGTGTNHMSRPEQALPYAPPTGTPYASGHHSEATLAKDEDALSLAINSPTLLSTSVNPPSAQVSAQQELKQRALLDSMVQSLGPPSSAASISRGSVLHAPHQSELSRGQHLLQQQLAIPVKDLWSPNSSGPSQLQHTVLPLASPVSNSAYALATSPAYSSSPAGQSHCNNNNSLHQTLMSFQQTMLPRPQRDLAGNPPWLVSQAPGYQPHLAAMPSPFSTGYTETSPGYYQGSSSAQANDTHHIHPYPRSTNTAYPNPPVHPDAVRNFVSSQTMASQMGQAARNVTHGLVDLPRPSPRAATAGGLLDMLNAGAIGRHR